MEKKYIAEAERETKIRGNYDVIVAGGGIAGVAAAVAAARNGVSVCLLEKEYALGGLATLGLVIAYLPLCDGTGNQVSTGLAEELLLLSTEDGSASVPECWQKNGYLEDRKKYRYFLEYNAASYILSLEKFVVQSGVDLLYDSRIVGVDKKDCGITAVFIETKSGREALKCKAIVDATGDADICFFAGEKTVSLNTNSASGWYYSTEKKGNKLHKLYKPFDPAGEGLPPRTERGYSGDKPEEITGHLLESRQMIRDDIAKSKKENPEDLVYPFLIPTFPGFRMTRRLAGKTEMDAVDRKEYPDSIGLIGNWRKAGPVYSIPLNALRGTKCRNLFAAGRCISAKRHGWDMTRVIPACAVTGEASGTAAALYAKYNSLNYKQLQKQLTSQSVKIYLKQIGEKS